MDLSSFDALRWSALSPSARNRELYRRLPPAPTAGTVCAPRRKLIIELDGSQHLKQQEYDEERTKHLEACGYRVLRFWNHDVLNNTESVLQAIWDALKNEDQP